MNADTLALFLPAAALVAASPGANNLLSLTHGIEVGLPLTVASLVGRFAAFALLIALVALGLGALLETSELTFRAVKWAGVAYLAWVGVRLWRSCEIAPIAVDGGAGASALVLARREFLVAITNPKAMLLFTAFLPQFAVPGEPFAPQLAALGALYIAVELVAACGYAALGASVRRIEITPFRARLINRTTGVMMLGAAALLATTKRSG